MLEKEGGHGPIDFRQRCRLAPLVFMGAGIGQRAIRCGDESKENCGTDRPSAAAS